MLLPDGSVAIWSTDPSGSQTIHVRPADYGKTVETLAPAPFAVYVPHTKRHPWTVAPSNAQWVDVSASDVAYYAALMDWWNRGETFMVLEHDVTCEQRVIDEFDACPELWCVFPYDSFCHDHCKDAWSNMLGCTRYRAELIEKVPDALLSIPTDNWDWHNVCDGLGDNLRAAGFTHHWHGPTVVHHRQVQSPGVAA